MKKKLLKITALVLAINFLTTTLAPTLMFALTAGPTAPEYTSFEPIDTTDMVNLVTGDFTYNIPLLEVPGPEGGYPLALSYHAGISPEEEASWVGLGWGLNAGAINRIVNVHPDDMKNESIAIHDTWSGGETEIYSIGVGIQGGGAGLSVGIDFANDTYKGTGTGVSIGAGIGLGEKSNMGLGINAGLGPYGGGYVGVGLGSATSGNGVNLAGSIGLNASFNDGDVQLAGTAGASLTYDKGYGEKTNASGQKVYKAKNSLSLVGADISTNSSAPSFSAAGISASITSDNSTDITIRSSGFSVPIPIPWTPLTINLGYRKDRYYTDAFDHENQLGVLYANVQNGAHEQSFDSYALKSTLSNDPFFDREIATGGGALPAYDSYNVVAQGMSGAIQPYLFESGTITRKVKWTDPLGGGPEYPEGGVVYDHAFKPYSPSKKISFRFINEFSNSMVVNADNLTGTSFDNYKTLSGAYDIGKAQLDYNDNNSKDFNNVTGALAGTKHVEWFTNAEINTAFNPGPGNTYPNKHLAKGFIPNVTDRSSYFSDEVYSVNVPNNIGGFMITNASGVNYHYAQPVYNFEETQVSYVNSSSNGNSFRRIDKPIPYAYSWLLTGITGPDYVDRGLIGQIDEADWGYWVKFEYGKWTDQYIWRTPNTGTEKDTWSEWQTYSAGKKELYYLDAIITRTHTALFVKDIRLDGKGIKEKENGGFGTITNASSQVTHCSASTLKLSRILLYSNRALSKVMEDSLSIQANDITGTPRVLAATRDELKAYATNQPNPQLPVVGYSTPRRLHYNERALTEADLINPVNKKTIKSKASRQIVFDHGYNLCQGTYNNKDINYANYTETATQGTNSGKLTLNNVSFLGYEGKAVVPPTSFTYFNPAPYEQDKKDIWGMYKSDAVQATVKQVNQTTTRASSANVHAWSLTGISTNIGADIEIEYESDQYKTVVLSPYYNLSASNVTILDPDITNRVKVYINTSELLTNIPELNVINPTVRIKYAYRRDQGPEGSIGEIGKYYKDIQVPVVGIGPDYLILEGAIIYDDFKNTTAEIPPVDETPGYTQYTNNYLLAANVLFDRNVTTNSYGGGLRVKSVSLKADNIINKTNYSYSNGVTAYEPFDLNVNFHNGANVETHNEVKSLVGSLYKDYFINIAANTSFLPSPGVYYEEVTVRDSVIDVTSSSPVKLKGVNYTVYNFMTYNQNMMPRTEGAESNIATDQYVKKVTFKDFRNFIGALKSINIYSSANNQLLSSTTNNYLHDPITNYNTGYAPLLASNYNNQGRIEHLYYEKKDFTLGNKEHLLITEVEEYPIVALGQTVLNGKTNISKESKAIAFDYYTGNPTMTWHQDGMGNHYLDVSTPAYSITQYEEMGLKVKNSGYKNMLTQQASAITYLVTPNITIPVKETDFTKNSVMTASVQTWFKNGTGIVYPATIPGGSQNYSSLGIWLKGTSYSWLGDEAVALTADGRYPHSNFTAFDFGSSPSNSQWQMDEQVTKYDVYSHPLESRNKHNKYSAILMDPLNIQMTATANLASRAEIAYAGGEFKEYYAFGEGAVGLGDGAISIHNVHTGKNSLTVGAGGFKGYTFTFAPQATRKYHASVWVYQPGGIDANGAPAEFKPRLIAKNKTTGAIIATGLPSEDQKARGIYLLSINIIPANYNDEIEVYCLNQNAVSGKPQYYDDFRVHPLDASMTSFVYDLNTGWLTHILDGDNLYSRFEYDHSGKLKTVYKELFRINEKLVTTGKYNYGK